MPDAVLTRKITLEDRQKAARLGLFEGSQHIHITPGQLKFMQSKRWRLGKKIYDVCCACGDNVRLNKPIIGDLHICIKERQC